MAANPRPGADIDPFEALAGREGHGLSNDRLEIDVGVFAEGVNRDLEELVHALGDLEVSDIEGVAGGDGCLETARRIDQRGYDHAA